MQIKFNFKLEVKGTCLRSPSARCQTLVKEVSHWLRCACGLRKGPPVPALLTYSGLSSLSTPRGTKRVPQRSSVEEAEPIRNPLMGIMGNVVFLLGTERMRALPWFCLLSSISCVQVIQTKCSTL